MNDGEVLIIWGLLVVFLAVMYYLNLYEQKKPRCKWHTWTYVEEKKHYKCSVCGWIANGFFETTLKDVHIP